MDGCIQSNTETLLLMAFTPQAAVQLVESGSVRVGFGNAVSWEKGGASGIKHTQR